MNTALTTTIMGPSFLDAGRVPKHYDVVVVFAVVVTIFEKRLRFS